MSYEEIDSEIFSNILHIEDDLIKLVSKSKNLVSIIHIEV